MQWEKCGMLWAPSGDAEWAVSHAALPVVQPIADNEWWIYLSMRNAAGQSHIGRITLDVSDKPTFRSFDPQPVLGLGDPGAFDDCGAMPSWLVQDGDLLRLYYTGWNVPSTVSYRLAIGMALSEDGGATFRRFSKGPVIDRSPEEPFFVCSPCVAKENGAWRMWYVACTHWQRIHDRWEPSYHVKYAESDDGVSWKLSGISCINPGEDYAVARPCVYRTAHGYSMIYAYRHVLDYRTNPEQAYRLGYAESGDGVTWRRMDDRVGIGRSETGWDSQMIEYGWLQRHSDQTYLLYNGNGFGRSGLGIARLLTAE